MVHVNNCTSEINAWAGLFEEMFTALGGGSLDRGTLFNTLYTKALEGDSNCGGLMGYNFLSGEPIAGVSTGIPMVTRAPEGRLTLGNFMRMQIYSALGSLAMGCEILSEEHVRIDGVCGHGGFFKTPFVGQSAMSAAVGAPVTVMENAGEGGAWGIAVLAILTARQTPDLEGLLTSLFADTPKTTVSADENEKKAFGAFMETYRKGLAVEKLAAEVLSCWKH